MSQDLDNVKEMTIVVQSEDGAKTQTYMLKGAADKVIEAAELEKAKADAIKEIEEKMVDELEKADASNDPHLITDYEAALTDKDTEFSFSGTRTMNGLLYENWFKSIEKETDANNLASFLTSALGQCDDIATAYVGALQTAADDAEEQAKFKALANQKAQAYLDAIVASLKANSFDWDGTRTVKELVETRIQYMADVPDPLNPGQDINKAECEVTVTAPSTVNFAGATGQDTVTVTVEVTNTYAGQKSDVKSAEIEVTFTW